MSNHTPGPWKIRRPVLSRIIATPDCYVVETPDDIVCVANTKADARLIAAAPEMVELLDDVAMELSIVSPILRPANGHVEALIERIDALLRRIEGEEV